MIEKVLKVSSYGPRPNCDLDEYWIGLENIHSLTSTGALLKIDLERYNGQSGTVEYDHFVVGDRRSNYQLKSVGTFRNDRNHDIGMLLTVTDYTISYSFIVKFCFLLFGFKIFFKVTHSLVLVSVNKDIPL